jgi:hypothetical protein
VLVARRLRPDRDPWPRIATFFLAYLLLTPWVFYWHEVPLLGIVAAIPWSLTSLAAVALSITLVPMVPAGPPAVGTAARGSPAADLLDTLAGFLSRYGAAFLVLWLGWRARRRASREGGVAAPVPADAARSPSAR